MLRGIRTIMTTTIPHAYSNQAPSLGLNIYLCIIPDLIPSTRLSIRPTHVANAKQGKANGWILQAGATFASDDDKTMTGSWLLISESSAAAAHARLSQDIYAREGAWDMSKATITPVAVAPL